MTFRLVLALLVCAPLSGQEPAGNLKLFLWERGVGFESPDDPKMRVYLWFYEWNMFEARKPGEHTGGGYDNPKTINTEYWQATVGPEDLRLTVTAGVESADLSLRVTNRSEHDWPELAGVIPCFNPGPEATRNRGFAHTNTYYHGAEGLDRLIKREIHFSERLRSLLDLMSPQGQFVFSHKWPTSPKNAQGGVIIRESTDGQWVTGIAWEDFLSAQGHNPWECMHLCVRVGPLARGRSRSIRGRVYLFPGDNEEAFERYLSDFGQ